MFRQKEAHTRKGRSRPQVARSGTVNRFLGFDVSWQADSEYWAHSAPVFKVQPSPQIYLKARRYETLQTVRNETDHQQGCQGVTKLGPCMLATSRGFTIGAGKLSGTRPQFCTLVNWTAPKISRNRCCQTISELSCSLGGMPPSSLLPLFYVGFCFLLVSRPWKMGAQP